MSCRWKRKIPTTEHKADLFIGLKNGKMGSFRLNRLVFHFFFFVSPFFFLALAADTNETSNL
jgi:hypothetical protein